MLMALTLIGFDTFEVMMTRKYDMKKRTNSAQHTKEKIIKSAEVLLSNGELKEVTLPAIAKGAGVTVQTVIRQMGSRDGCLSAVAKTVYERVAAQRGEVKPGDIDSTITVLIDHYESEGRLMLNLLKQENKNESFLLNAIKIGREYHKNWVKHCFGPLMDKREETLDALIAITDIYLYKILRLDMGRSIKTTTAIINNLVRGILERS